VSSDVPVKEIAAIFDQVILTDKECPRRCNGIRSLLAGLTTPFCHSRAVGARDPFT